MRRPGEPKVFVLWRMAEAEDAAEPRARPLIVTVSYGEAARFLDAGEQVDAVPMPAALLAALETLRRRPLQARAAPKRAKRNALYEEAAGARRAPTDGRG